MIQITPQMIQVMVGCAACHSRIRLWMAIIDKPFNSLRAATKSGLLRRGVGSTACLDLWHVRQMTDPYNAPALSFVDVRQTSFLMVTLFRQDFRQEQIAVEGTPAMAATRAQAIQLSVVGLA